MSYIKQWRENLPSQIYEGSDQDIRWQVCLIVNGVWWPMLYIFSSPASHSRIFFRCIPLQCRQEKLGIVSYIDGKVEWNRFAFYFTIVSVTVEPANWVPNTLLKIFSILNGSSWSDWVASKFTTSTLVMLYGLSSNELSMCYWKWVGVCGVRMEDGGVSMTQWAQV